MKCKQMTTKQQGEILSYIKLINEKLWDGKESPRKSKKFIIS